MNQDLVKLLDLQTRDLALIELDARALEIAAEEAELEKAVVVAEKRIGVAAKDVVDAKGRQDELEERIESYKKLNDRRRLRLETVRNPKEAATLMAELDLAQSVVKREEGEWVKSADSVTGAEDRVKQAAAAVETVREGQAEARAAVAAKRAALEADRAAATAARDDVRNTVDKTLRARYERLFNGRKRAVVVAMVGITCSACRTAVPTSRRSQIRSGLLLDGCESCGVILYSEGSEG